MAYKDGEVRWLYQSELRKFKHKSGKVPKTPTLDYYDSPAHWDRKYSGSAFDGYFRKHATQGGPDLDYLRELGFVRANGKWEYRGEEPGCEADEKNGQS